MRGLLILLAVVSLLVVCCGSADAADPGKFMSKDGYTLGLYDQRTSDIGPFAAIWKDGITTPEVAVFVEKGKIWLQVRDGKDVKYLRLDTLKDGEKSPFKPAAWGRGGCADGQCAAPVAAVAVPAPPVVAVVPVAPAAVAGPLFSPGEGAFMDRGPVRRLLSRPWRGSCRARR